ncbi:MAG: hypothetical protein V4695_08965 [Pseudomonadota bacterium]
MRAIFMYGANQNHKSKPPTRLSRYSSIQACDLFLPLKETVQINVGYFYLQAVMPVAKALALS